jgi:hypothetical protein
MIYPLTAARDMAENDVSVTPLASDILSVEELPWESASPSRSSAVPEVASAVMSTLIAMPALESTSSDLKIDAPVENVTAYVLFVTILNTPEMFALFAWAMDATVVFPLFTTDPMVKLAQVIF